ncbi:AAA family ATPase [Sorangium sp. So ce1389]|uniref:AAA family ATPase n=1 Tax=Sorangium sp. So ce1389 TaxID=3133336 RepID=UPI003F61E4E1
MTSEERSHIDNAIWMCANHATLIDRDEVTYTVEVLKSMKAAHEARVAEAVRTGGRPTVALGTELIPNEPHSANPRNSQLRASDEPFRADQASDDAALSRAIVASAAFDAASQVLRSWPQTLGWQDDAGSTTSPAAHFPPLGWWLDRPELAMLLDAVQRQDTKPLLLLGGPGSGKSALLSRLLGELRARGVEVLALRADDLTHGVDTLQKLQNQLGLPDAPASMLRAAASRGRAVLIIDQLDALSDLIDAQTQRLSILLRLIEELRATPGVGIVVSCREFEFRHDRRFRQLTATPVQLTPLPADTVQRVLADHGVDRMMIGGTLLEALRVPQHLKMFLSLMRGRERPPIFDTYQQVLEELWQERVVRRDGDPKRERVLTEIARYMADHEDLRAPLARFTADVAPIEQLEADGILRREAGRSIAFSHQTWYAFARARAFLTGVEEVADHVRRCDGSLFVRSTVWTALVNLRAAAPGRYRDQIHSLWSAPDLRPHLRALLIEFLGQVEDPTNDEASLLLPTLAREGYPRQVALQAMAGSRRWFERVAQRHLPVLMTGAHAGETWWLLARALPFAQATVLDLIERHWLHEPERARLVLFVLREVTTWDERAMQAAIAIVRSDAANSGLDRMLIGGLVSAIRKSDVAAAVRLVRAALDRGLARCRAESATAPESRWNHPCRGLIEHDHGLDGLIELAKASPPAFVEHVWPWFVDALADLAEKQNPLSATYRRDYGTWTWRWTERISPRPVHELPEAIDVAIDGLARLHPEEFLALVRTHASSDLHTVHELLARGLMHAVEHAPSQVVDYLVGDPRRLLLDAPDAGEGTSCELIERVAPHAARGEVARLEAAIQASHKYADEVPGLDARDRFWRQRYERLHRLRLLRALQGSAYLSMRSRAQIDQEGRALADLDVNVPVRFGFVRVESPMRAGQMLKARDADIANLFAELPDSADRHRHADSMRGGSVEASRALAETAQTDPRRALAFALEFEPGVHERPVAYVLEEVAKSSDTSLVAELEGVILGLNARGFASQEFREHAAWALREIAQRRRGLSDDACLCLSTWLRDEPKGEESADHDEERPGRAHSVLLSLGGGRVLPGGNCTILLALTAGYLYREPEAYDNLLSVFETHAVRAERSSVWCAVIRHFADFPDVDRVLALTEQIFARHPRVRDSVEGARHMAQMCRRTDDVRLWAWLEGMRTSSWGRGAQAYGEILMVLEARQRGCSWAAEALESALDQSCSADDIDRVRLGIAYMVVHLWDEPPDRSLCTRVLLRLFPFATDEIAAGIAGIFGRNRSFPDDEATRDVLDAFLQYPRVLAAGDPHDVVLQLQNLCAEEPARVLALCAMLLDESARSPEGVGRLSVAGSEFTDLALTLMRMHGFRKEGLDLFERLLEAGVYGVHETLREFNVRPDAECERRIF